MTSAWRDNRVVPRDSWHTLSGPAIGPISPLAEELRARHRHAGEHGPCYKRAHLMKPILYAQLLVIGLAALQFVAGCASADPDASHITEAENYAGSGPCVPRVCRAGMCGDSYDDCGHTLHCGGCAPGQVCDNSLTPNECRAIPPLCTPTKKCGARFCGVIDDDGCGTSLCCTGGCPGKLCEPSP